MSNVGWPSFCDAMGGLSLFVGRQLLALFRRSLLRAAGVTEKTIDFTDERGVRHTASYLEREGDPTAEGAPVPAVLGLHGFSSESANMAPLFPVGLHPPGARIVLLDSPGHGGSVSSNPDYDGIDTEDMKLYISGFTAAIGLADTPYHLVGYSLGGVLAMLHADNRPAEVNKLVLMAPGFSDFFAAEFSNALNREPRDWSEIHCWETATDFAAFVRLYLAPPGAKAIPQFICEAIAEQRQQKFGPGYFTRIAERLIFVEAAKAPFSMLASRSAIKGPGRVLVVWGDADTCIDTAQAAKVAEDLGGAELYIEPDCGHAFNRKLKPLTQLCRRKVATFLYGAAVPDRPAKRGMASVATAAAAAGGVAVVAVALHYFQH